MAVQSRGYAANENVSGDGSFAEWPFVWKQPLCSAGNARRLSIISTGSLLCCEPRRERGACGLTHGVQKKNPVSMIAPATYGLTLNNTKKKKNTHTKNTTTNTVHFPRWWRLRSLSSPDQRQQINRKLRGDFFFPD